MREDTQDRIVARAEDVVRVTTDFMEQLVALRDKHGLRQHDVAERMSVSQPTVAAFERYDANPTLASVQRYAIAVGAKLTMVADDDLVDEDALSTFDDVDYRGEGVACASAATYIWASPFRSRPPQWSFQSRGLEASPST